MVKSCEIANWSCERGEMASMRADLLLLNEKSALKCQNGGGGGGGLRLIPSRLHPLAAFGAFLKRPARFCPRRESKYSSRTIRYIKDICSFPLFTLLPLLLLGNPPVIVPSIQSAFRFRILSRQQPDFNYNYN